MILVFDLDDTLYEEITYVRSGFQAVANYLKDKYDIPDQEGFAIMIQALETLGRGKVFDAVLHRFNIYSSKNVHKCVTIYRLHAPIIKLSSDGEACLERFRDFPTYIVTDGNKVVQKNKLLALGIYDRVKHPYITHRYGIKNSKPSPYCFLKICERERVSPDQVVYIGDNPNKDFVGIKPLGFNTIRVLTGHFKDLVKDSEFEAHCNIKSLDELTVDLVKDLINSNK